MMSLELWKKHLQRSFGQAPGAPGDELEQVLRKVRADIRPHQRAASWPGYLCLASLSLGILVTIFVTPNNTSDNESSFSLLSLELTTPYDESLDSLRILSESTK